MFVRILASKNTSTQEEPVEIECPGIDDVFVHGGDPMISLHRRADWMARRHRMPDENCELVIVIYTDDTEVQVKDNGILGLDLVICAISEDSE